MKIALLRNRLTFVALLFFGLSIALISRMTWIQIIGDPRLEKLGKRQFQSHMTLTPRRGGIVDRTGEPLAINVEVSSLAGNPQKILKSSRTQILLSKALGITPSQLKKRLDEKKSFTWLARHLSDQQLHQFKKINLLQETSEMPEGLWLVKEMKRVYPHGDLAAPLIGSVNIDTQGLEGVELWKNKNLAGTSTKVDAVRDALGRTALFDTSKDFLLEDGKNVQLTIDVSLQYAIENALKDSIQATRSDGGLVIVMDARSGEIVALAQQPTFNPNLRHQNAQTRKLKALTDGFEPGSTFKPLLLASALSHGQKLTDHVNGHQGQFKVQGKPIREAESHEKFGQITLKKMIEVSSNIGAAELALHEGAERYIKTLRLLGLGTKTGVEFPGEITGWMPAQNKAIKPLTLANMGFGQGVLITPLQLVRAYAALANGGFLVEPSLVKTEKALPSTSQSSLTPSVLTPKVTQGVTQALLSVVEGEQGTGKNAALDGYKIAGKTGTAQTVDPKTKTYSKKHYISSFVGYSVGTEKTFVILTLLDYPKNSYYASVTAAPLFRNAMEHTLSRFSVPATEPLKTIPQVKNEPSPEKNESQQAHAPFNQDLAKRVQNIAQEALLEEGLMPNLIGLTPQEAMKRVKNINPQFSLHGFGVVKKQVPEQGTEIKLGEKVSLYLNE